MKSLGCWAARMTHVRLPVHVRFARSFLALLSTDCHALKHRNIQAPEVAGLLGGLDDGLGQVQRAPAAKGMVLRHHRVRRACQR